MRLFTFDREASVVTVDVTVNEANRDERAELDVDDVIDTVDVDEIEARPLCVVVIIAVTVGESSALGESDVSGDTDFEPNGDIDPRGDCDILRDPDDDAVMVTSRVPREEIEIKLDTDDEPVTVINGFE